MAERVVDFDEVYEEVQLLKRTFNPAMLTDAVRWAAGRTGEKAVEMAGEYPVPSGKPLYKYYTRTDVAGRSVAPYKSKFKSAKQAYFVLKLAGWEETEVPRKRGTGYRIVLRPTGGGRIPYRRTGTLGRSIISSEQVSNLVAEVRVGTNLSYAPLVIGDQDEQSEYHQGTWPSLYDQLRAGLHTLENVFVGSFRVRVRYLMDQMRRNF